MRIVDAQLARAVGELQAEGSLQGRELAIAFTQFLRRKRLTHRAGKISRAFEAYTATVSGVEHAVVTTARPLEALARSHVSRVAASLLGKPGREMTLNFQVDPALIGGVRIETDDTRYDSSISRTLRELHKSL